MNKNQTTIANKLNAIKALERRTDNGIFVKARMAQVQAKLDAERAKNPVAYDVHRQVQNRMKTVNYGKLYDL